ncbi:MAG: sugar-binding protein [Pseudomarimonas sp.]
MKVQYLTATLLTPALLLGAALTAQAAGESRAQREVNYHAPQAAHPLVIDGRADEPDWQRADWRPLQHEMDGRAPDSALDFSARYRALWRSDALYLLVELRDDILLDSVADPLDHYWDDDALEIFIDEDNAGGPHLFDDAAYAYHIALDGQVVDIGPREDGTPGPRTYPDHVHARWSRDPIDPTLLIWEVRVQLYAQGAPTTPVLLHPGKRIGFMLAYCDSDQPGTGREHFVGDIEITPRNGSRNLGYLNADVFGVMLLVD